MRFMATKPNIPFSQTPAFEAVNRRAEFFSPKPIYVPNYYDSIRYKLIRFFSFLGSITSVVIYIAFFRYCFYKIQI